MRIPHVKPIFDVRWRLEYNDGTAPKWGPWTRPETDFRQMVAFKRTDNLARAFIETRDKRDRKYATPVHCAGWDFVMFKWEYIAHIGAAINAPIKTQKCPYQVIGLILITRDFETIVRVDGSPPVIRIRTEADKKFHYEGFGK